MKKKGGSNMDVEWLDHLWSREVEWGHVWMSAHLDWLSFITPKKGLRGYVGMGLLDIAEVAADVAVVGLGRPAAKVFDAQSQVREASLSWVEPGRDCCGTRSMWRLIQ